MKLIRVCDHDHAPSILYRLLGERDEAENISHRQMPTWEKHIAFITRKCGDGPDAYGDWNLIEEDGEVVGSIYVTKADEIGVHLFRRFQNGQGRELIRQAIRLQMHAWGSDRVLLNVNPKNRRLAKLAQDMGFGLLQYTYCMEAR